MKSYTILQFCASPISDPNMNSLGGNECRQKYMCHLVRLASAVRLQILTDYDVVVSIDVHCLCLYLLPRGHISFPIQHIDMP